MKKLNYFILFLLVTTSWSLSAQETCGINPFYKVGKHSWWSDTIIKADVGEALAFGPQLTDETTEGGTWAWTGPDGFTADSINPLIDSVPLNYSGGAFEVTYTSPTGCVATKGFSITVTEAPPCKIYPFVNFNRNGWTTESDTLIGEVGYRLSFGPQTRDYGTASAGWVITGPNGYSENRRGPTIARIAKSDSGTFVMTNTDPDGCVSTSNVELVVLDTFTCKINPSFNLNGLGWQDGDTIVEAYIGDDVQFGPNTALYGGAVGLGWSWTGPNSYVSDTRAPSLNDLVALNSGIYTVTNTDERGCVASQDFHVSVDTPQCAIIPRVKINGVWDTTKLIRVTAGDSLILSPESEEFGTAGDWTLQGPIDTLEIRELVIDSLHSIHSGTYTVIDTNQQGCVSTSTIKIRVDDTTACKIWAYYQVNGTGGWPRADTISEPIQLTVGDMFRFGPQTRDDKQKGSWLYEGPNGYSESRRDPTIDPIAIADAGTYTVINVNTTGCMALFDYQLEVAAVCEILPSISVNGGEWSTDSEVTVDVGDTINIAPTSKEFGTDEGQGWSWTGPGFTASTRTIAFDSIVLIQKGVYTVSNTDENGCTDDHAFTINVNPPIIDAISLSRADSKVISVFPNPVSGQTFTLDFNGRTASEISVYSITGSKVYYQRITQGSINSLELTTPSEAGIYVVRMTDLQGESYATKFIVK